MSKSYFSKRSESKNSVENGYRILFKHLGSQCMDSNWVQMLRILNFASNFLLILGNCLLFPGFSTLRGTLGFIKSIAYKLSSDSMKESL